MRKIPGGRFTMGRTYQLADEPEYLKNEIPAQPVDISSFNMGSTLATVGMWREYLRANPALSMPEPPDWGWIDSHPMVKVSWHDLNGIDGTGGYCEWASRVTGVNLSLPSEAQWEFVAKGGHDYRYPWGNKYDETKVWCSLKNKFSGTAPVNRATNVFVNKYGISDLTGHLYQHCDDGYLPYVKTFDRLGYVKVSKDPIGTGEQKSFRGGSWGLDNPGNFRVTKRGGGNPYLTGSVFGFRLVAPPK